MDTTTAAAQYLALRVEFHTTGNYDAADASTAIADAAYGTADAFDEVALDEAARITANGGRPLTTA